MLAAGYDASMFTLSLPRNYRNQMIADFARVEGLPGVYMANQLEASVFEDPSSIPYDKNFNDFLQTKVSSVVLPVQCNIGSPQSWKCTKSDLSIYH